MPTAIGSGIPPDSLARLALPAPLALRESMERMERREQPVQLVYRVRLDPTLQAEHAIRHPLVTGVQTCALPIQPVSYRASPPPGFSSPTRAARARLTRA